MPRIVIDARKYADFGIGTYIRGLLSGFASSLPEYHFHVLTLPGERLEAGLPPSWTSQSVSYRRYGLGEFIALGSVVRRSEAALFHSPHYTLPLSPGLPTIVTVHDLIHLRFPKIFSTAQRAYARLMIRHAVSKAAAIITPSYSTKLDLIERFLVPAERITVTSLGVGKNFRALDGRSSEEYRRSEGLPDRFALFIGNPKAHKGLSILLQAIRIILRQNKKLPLLIAGVAEPLREALLREISANGLSSLVRLISYVPAENMPALINSATMLVMPSLWEGFGLPVIESMACGTPVICSTAGSLPEVAGDAALKVPPGDAEALAEALLQLFEGDDLRADLRKRGLERASKFTWEHTAQATKAVYDAVLS